MAPCDAGPLTLAELRPAFERASAVRKPDVFDVHVNPQGIAPATADRW
ncbi:MAG: hypothetical protein M0Z42_17125 [Actinomycetota bacterium]|jgi:hypothetical protein|nr:hypothetical protein [Actinomycetota bacterium]